jgi:aminopeptidase N
VTYREARACACHTEFAAPGTEPRYAPDLLLEPTHLSIALTVDLEQARASGHVTTTVVARAQGVHTLVLDALGLTQLSVDGHGDTLDAAYDGSKVSVAFRTPFAEGESRDVTVRYAVVEPASGLLFSRPTEAMPDAAWFAVTDHETERARHWLPSVDHPSVRPTLAFTLTADSRFTILANGALVSSVVNADGTTTARYELAQRCPSYLTCFAIGDFNLFEEGEVGAVKVSAYAPTTWPRETLERTFRGTVDRLRFFESRLGVPYPYPKYAQFAVRGIGGAMENVSLVSWDDRFMLVSDAHAAEERALFEVVDAHEMAHAWFGDLVTCRDFAHAWLKESWATYMEAVYIEHAHGRDARDYDLFCNAEAYFRECDERYHRPIVTRRFESSWDLYDMHLYPGGAWRIHMLRMMLGDDVFWPAVTAYIERHAGGVVETDDFRRVLEERSGRSLARFFDDYLFTAGFPELDVTFAYDVGKARGTFEVRQRQVEKGTTFAFPLEVAFVIDGVEHTRTLDVNAARATLVVPMTADPERIAIDPDLKTLARVTFDPGEPRSRRSLREGRTISERIFAGRALVASGRRVDTRALVDAYRVEQESGVRVKWLEALGNAGTEAALEALLALCDAHAPRDAREGAPLFRALGRYRDVRVVAAVLARLDAKSIPDGTTPLGPRAREAALEALGAQRALAPLDRIEDAAKNATVDFERMGALRALGASHAPRAQDALEALGLPGSSSIRTRPSAASALGELASSLEARERTRAVEWLVDRLRDPDGKVRAAAGGALVTARAVEAKDALLAFAATLTPQERIRVERSVASMTKPAEGEVATLRKKLEALEAESRKLGGRVEVLERDRA